MSIEVVDEEDSGVVQGWSRPQNFNFYLGGCDKSQMYIGMPRDNRGMRKSISRRYVYDSNFDTRHNLTVP